MLLEPAIPGLPPKSEVKERDRARRSDHAIRLASDAELGSGSNTTIDGVRSDSELRCLMLLISPLKSTEAPSVCAGVSINGSSSSK